MHRATRALSLAILLSGAALALPSHAFARSSSHVASAGYRAHLGKPLSPTRMHCDWGIICRHDLPLARRWVSILRGDNGIRGGLGWAQIICPETIRQLPRLAAPPCRTPALPALYRIPSGAQKDSGA